jgi:hypothetical protein
VERAVAEARPRHLGDIRAYAECHRDRLELVVDPLVVEGGEAAKNDAAAPARLQGRFQAARMDRSDVLGLLAREDRSGHLEVETYTWDVLPEEYQREDIVTAVARELHWVMERLPA